MMLVFEMHYKLFTDKEVFLGSMEKLPEVGKKVYYYGKIGSGDKELDTQVISIEQDTNKPTQYHLTTEDGLQYIVYLM